MTTAARLPLAAWRNELCVRRITIVGLDLTGTELRGQVRLGPNTSGAPLIPLAKVDTAAAEGLKIDGVTVVGGVPTSVILLRINQSSMSDPAKVPYGGARADDVPLSYQIQFGGTTRIYGDFIVKATTMDSDSAPASLPASAAATSGAQPWAAAQLTFGNDDITVTIDGTDALGPLVDRAISAADAAADSEAAAAGSAAAAAANAAYFNNDALVPDAEFAVQDSAGNLLFRVTPDSIVHPLIMSLVASQTLGAVAAAAVSSSIGETSYSIADSAGNLMALVTPDDILHPYLRAIDTRAKRGVYSASIARRRDPRPDEAQFAPIAKILHFLYTGQSWTAGGVYTFQGDPGAYARMFNGGIHSREGLSGTDMTTDTSARRSSLVQMTETVREIGLRSAVKMIAQLLLEEDGIDLAASGQLLLGSMSGTGGQNLASLNSTYYAKNTQDMASGRACADALGMSYGSGANFFLQGESDQANATRASYLAAERAWQLKIQGDWQAQTGDTRPVPMITYQTNTHFSQASANYYNPACNVARAQLDAALDVGNVNPNIAMATPTYFLRLVSDGVHPEGIEAAWLGAFLGLAAKRWLWDGLKPVPLVPAGAKSIAGSKFIYLPFRMEPGRQLVVHDDPIACPLQPNLGFAVKDSAGNPLTITGVTLAGPGRVEIALAAAVPAGALVQYAMTTNVSGGTKGLGNIRDNGGDLLIANPSGIAKPMHKFAPLFDIGVTQ